MRTDDLTVFIIDDDPAVRDSIALLLGLAGFRTALYADAEAFLAAYSDNWAGCAVADVRLPGMSGVELQARLRARGCTLPFVIITAHGDVPMARAAFQGAEAGSRRNSLCVVSLRAARERSPWALLPLRMRTRPG